MWKLGCNRGRDSPPERKLRISISSQRPSPRSITAFLVTILLAVFLETCSGTHAQKDQTSAAASAVTATFSSQVQDGRPSHLHPLFSRGQRIQVRVSREVHDSVRGSFRHREKREILLSSTLHQDGGHLEKIKMTLPLDGKTHVVDLQLNRELIPRGYFERTQRENETVVQRPMYQEMDDCHYQGKIRGLARSWAALSTCDDLIRGAVFDGDQLHYIEPPVTPLEKAEDEDNVWDVVHLKQEHFTRNLSCGHDGSHGHEDGETKVMDFPGSELLSMDSSSVRLNRVKRSYSSHDDTRVPYNSNGKSRYVELVIVVDNKKYKELGADIKAVRRRTKDIASIVNALYAPLNIFIALVGMVVWTESDEIMIKPNGDETLASFLHYRKERLLKDHPNDNAQLLTAVEFENGVVGKAMQGPICSYKYSGGVNSDFKNNVIGVVATTVAHELGHNFGLSHDAEGCKCPSPNNRCIMAASASSNRTMHWSSCSLKDFAYAFDHGMDYCLRNRPLSLYDGPTCGNGFTEPGEECDCGLEEHCENPCCDASTCLMHLNATCASGTCCDMETCHVKAGGSLCRDASKLCDLPEYCTGESEFCPEDVTKMDGLECDTPSGQAYCYNGECRTHTDQCKLLWGPSGNNSNDLCYQKNANGSRHAHCGYNLTTEKYARCNVEDVKCGILHCQMNSEKLEFGYESVSILASFFVNAGGKIHPCRSVIVDFGLYDINPGMVPDGAKCGDDKMCVDQKCVPVGSILGSKYPLCGHDCSGRGTCNSKGHCHCDEGYGGTYCEASGYGGSIDSGPARDPYGTSRFFKIIYVTFLGFIPLIAIITFYVYYAGDYFKKLCLSVVTLQAFTRNARSQRSNKPSSNGSAGGGLRTYDISAPTSASNATSPTQNNVGSPSGGGGEDFFGQYKGFSLSPIKSSPLPQQRNGGPPNHSSATSSHHNNNNNDSPVTTLPNGTIQSQTNANVYYSSVAKQTETLVGNSGGSGSGAGGSDSSRPTGGFRLANPQQSFLQNSSGARSVTRVSWAQPIASPLPVSPGSEDESANSDTPLYENTGAEKNSPKIQKLAQPTPIHQLQQQKQRPMSSPDTLDEMKHHQSFGSRIGFGLGRSNENATKKDSPFGSTSALSRLAAAIPFVRSSFRLPSSSSSSGDSSNKYLEKKTPKVLPKNLSRGNLEISKPILQTDSEGAASHGGDQVDSCPRYANVPIHNPGEEHQIKKPALKNVDRARGVTPPPESTSKPFPKVQRAHSMIQPSSSNRNSIHNGNSNYNSLRRSRPSVPPPKPPEAPPPPPPTYMQSCFSEAKAKFLQTSAPITTTASPTPPPVPPPNNIPSTSSSPKGLRSSIAKFSFGQNRSRSQSPTTTPPKPSVTSALFKAPIAKVEELSSPCSPPEANGIIKRDKSENIYDTIDEGMVTAVLNVAAAATAASNNANNPNHQQPRKGSLEASSSGESSPTPGKGSRRGSEEKIETLSTGSSESAGGLLNDIILEIQQRNKESIYNSVDRRKQRREKKMSQANSSLMRDRDRDRNHKPEITPKPLSATLSKVTTSKTPSPASVSNSIPNSADSTSKVPNNTSLSQFSPNSNTTKRYMSPLTNQSFSFYKRPSGPSSTSPSVSSTQPEVTPVNGTLASTKSKVVLNPTLTRDPEAGAAFSSSTSISTTPSRPTYTPSIYAASSTSAGGPPQPRSIFSSTFSRTGLSTSTPKSSSSNVSNKDATKAPPVPPHGTSSGVALVPTSTSKPTCAVNGVPKVTSSPSYVAKINYFSNLSQAANSTPMKPINSIPAPSKENPAKEIIYASSNVDLNEMDRDGKGHERGHYAATIRRSRPQYYNNKDLESNMNDANSNPVTDNGGNRNKGTLGRKPMGIYGSLGRKVATPVIRSNSIEKEKREARSRESTPETRITSITTSASDSRTSSQQDLDGGSVHSSSALSSASIATTDTSNNGESPQVGYKPFNPYLNRPLTFSTFRPANNSPSSATTGSNGLASNKQPVTAPLCSISQKPLASLSNGVGVASPVRLRSPNRLVK